MTEDKKLTFVNVRIMLQNCSPIDSTQQITGLKVYQSLTMARQLHATAKEEKAIKEMIAELPASVRSKSLVPFSDLGKHISGTNWCEDKKSKDILLILAMLVGQSELVNYKGKQFVRIWT